ncbi:hypothetical protein [Parabacteroides pacaensis]|uniref:hypothetical protein n=1 Tax=Parabacteroides pacaensis TaxID=2086575 RepID=UPI000D10DF58|nr:hypothetical protein [Parabacteroides pacaensis]
MRKTYFLILLFCCSTLFAVAQKQPIKSLVPDKPSKAPDYLCTWNLQGYVVNYESSDMMRKAMNEENIFGKGKYQNWIGLYPSIRQDLYFVMDDSWDIPKDRNTTSDNPYLGTTELNTERFPSFTGTPTERLKKLSDRMKREGWKGAGGWICAQKAGNYADVSEEVYWMERIKAADEAGWSYWKVDWGTKCRDDGWRQMLTTLGKQYAPHLFIEHAMKNEYIEFSDVFRTYDVENIIAQPVTIQRICDLLPYKAQEGVKGLINCEDEPYIAAGLGCVIGVMRHPFVGNLPNGKQDHAFPPVGRDLKKRLDEVVRGVRWHRIAEPFAVGGDFAMDKVKLEDSWVLHKDETWVKRKENSVLKESAPARVSRGMALPEVSDTGNDRPFILASRYPNGAVAIASIGRALGREYVSKEVSVTVPLENWDVPIGLFGCFKEVTFILPTKISGKKIYAQDLAGETPVNITRKVKVKGNRLTLPGEIIRKIGLMNASEGDCSDPGLVLKIIK